MLQQKLQRPDPKLERSKGARDFLKRVRSKAKTKTVLAEPIPNTTVLVLKKGLTTSFFLPSTSTTERERESVFVCSGKVSI